jgi:hypothetical protein
MRQNKKTGKVSKCYHLAMSLLWNKDIDRKCKITVHTTHFNKTVYYFMEQRHGYVL